MPQAVAWRLPCFVACADTPIAAAAAITTPSRKVAVSVVIPGGSCPLHAAGSRAEPLVAPAASGRSSLEVPVQVEQTPAATAGSDEEAVAEAASLRKGRLRHQPGDAEHDEPEHP